MGDRALEGIVQAATDVDHQSRGLGRFEQFADLDEFAQVPPLDELHHEVVQVAAGMHFVDRHDVRVPQRAPSSPSRRKRLYCVGDLAEAVAEGLDRHHLAGIAVDGPKHAGKRTRPHQVQDLVVAEEEAGSLALHQSIDLVVGQKLVADEGLQEVV